jgi:2-succinyl-6-hydroxy-2,4-cyclohexadiene-1-carboxylate synthase
MEGSMRILILHGNFESELDWKPFVEAVGSKSLNKENIEVEVFNLWDFLKRNNPQSWLFFIEEFKKHYRDNTFDCVVGYSLGGRILLALLDTGWLVQKAIFLSTHTGLSSEEDRHSRIWNDLKWKEKVLSLGWKELYEEWNSQEVFASDTLLIYENFASLESLRSEIAHAFDVLSLGRSQDFTQSLVSLSLKMELNWCTGELDTKFGALAKSLAEKAPRIQFKSLKGAGHRIHRSNPAVLEEVLGLL